MNNIKYKYLFTILVGMSASGKTAIKNKMIENYEFSNIVTCTTRKPRINEKNGVDYFFLSKETFEMNIKKENFIEFSKNGEDYYGTLKKDFDLSKRYIIVLDLNGAKTFSQYVGKNNCNIVYIYCSSNVRRKRMIQRGDSENWNNRLNLDKKQFTDKNINSICNMQGINCGTRSLSQTIHEILGD